jgi:NAD(P)-dependent dehydrogenase (short-subunit alcohol dehydrogenase family)
MLLVGVQEGGAMDKPLRDKVAIVTGAGRGIGRAVAIAYGRAGAKVAVVSRTAATVNEVVTEIEKEGGTAVGITCNVGRREDVYGMVDKTVKAFGVLHVLVNNAQSFGTSENVRNSASYVPFAETDEAEWEYTFLTGATATLWAMKAAFPYLKTAGCGRVVNFGSSAGQRGQEGFACYVATKEAIRGITRTAAREWGRYGITVNVICPWTETDTVAAFKNEQPESYAALLATVPMRRAGDSLLDLAPFMVFLASDAAGYMTGATFNVEGGLNLFP